MYLLWFFSFSDGQITAILDQKNYVEELNRHLRFIMSLFFTFPGAAGWTLDLCDVSDCSASVNNLQAKVDALEKSNTKLTEEVRTVCAALGILTVNTAYRSSRRFSLCLWSLQLQITESSLYKKTWREWRRKAPISWSPGRFVLPQFDVCTPEEGWSFPVLFKLLSFYRQ